ncbi:LTV1 -like protein [Brachionus plicatilis]|uniref:Protein LTV1 homolog n=1 Tax=Brachionus plicatilis TaxID=10195 RepID=A0A3M7QYK6_BRAPC|nr:LTV1 -like protein [Brachionus plicatilis]
MGGKKKQFIKKGEGVKFHLVHRSQKDPLYLDETLGERVLMPADEDVDEKLIESVNGLNLANGSQTDRTEQRFKRIEEQHKFGVYYDDDYDYLQHLRDADQEDRVNLEPEMIKVGSVLIKNEEEAEKPKLQLPSSVFASKVEEDIGYFNQAAPDHDPKIDWDPDIVKILDEDADVEYTDDLDDDFFLKANTELEAQGQDEDDDEDDEEDYDSDDLVEEESESVQDFESKSRFSNYSMTSSVIRRNQALSHLDEHFEKFFAQYDEDQIGALDTEDIDGYRINDDVIEMALQEFSKYVEKNKYQTEKVSRKSELGAVAEENSDGESVDEQDENNNDFDMVHFCHKKDKQDRFDCESIISTYSNLYNHPSMISERREKIALSKKTGLPLGVLGEKAKTQKELDKIDHRITRILPEVPKRHRDESKEEKKARKQAIKEHRRERRIEKKVNKLAFKEEKKTQACQIKTTMDNSNIVKIP